MGGLPIADLQVRENALATLEHYISTGQPMHPSERAWISAVIGQLTPAEETRLDGRLAVAQFREMRRREEAAILHRYAEDLRRNLEPPTA